MSMTIKNATVTAKARTRGKAVALISRARAEGLEASGSPDLNSLVIVEGPPAKIDDFLANALAMDLMTADMVVQSLRILVRSLL